MQTNQLSVVTLGGRKKKKRRHQNKLKTLSVQGKKGVYSESKSE